MPVDDIDDADEVIFVPPRNLAKKRPCPQPGSYFVDRAPKAGTVPVQFVDKE